MTAHSSRGFMLSLALHLGVIVLVVVFALAVRHNAPPPPQVFELVAGAGDNYTAAAAPALGSPDVVKLDVPARPPAPSAPVQAAPQPVEPLPAVTAEPEAVIESPKAKSKATPKPKEKSKPRDFVPMSKAEFDRLHPRSKTPASSTPPGPIKVRRIAVAGIELGVAGGSADNRTGGAGGKALTAPQQDILSAYIALLLQRLRAALVQPEGVSDQLHVVVSFHVSAGGALTQARVTSSSGSQAFDQAVLAAFARVRSIGPTPDGRSYDWQVNFKLHEEGG